MDKRLLTISLLASIVMLHPAPTQAQVPSALEALRAASGGATFTVPMAQPAPAFFSSAPPEDSVVSRVRRTMTSGMAPDVQQFIRTQVHVFTVSRDQFLPNVVAATLRERLPRDQTLAF